MTLWCQSSAPQPTRRHLTTCLPASLGQLAARLGFSATGECGLRESSSPGLVSTSLGRLEGLQAPESHYSWPHLSRGHLSLGSLRLPWGERISSERTSLLTGHLLAVAPALACWTRLPESREHISLFTKAVPVLGTCLAGSHCWSGGWVDGWIDAWTDGRVRGCMNGHEGGAGIKNSLTKNAGFGVTSNPEFHSGHFSAVDLPSNVLP